MDILLNNRTYNLIDGEVVGNGGSTYEIGEKIGRGGNGTVYECINQAGDLLAIKFLSRNTDKSKKRFSQEIALMKKVSHPHVIKYLDDGVAEMAESEKIYNIYKTPFVIMEKADSNLIDYMKINSDISYIFYAPQFRGLCEALLEIHKYAIHRDIKPENILVKGETWILSDFGLCEFIDESEHQDLTGENEKVGPIYWMSPEAINKYYFSMDEIGTYSDIYQIGMIFAFVLMRKYPGGIIGDEAFNGIPNALKKVVLKTLNNNRNERPQNGFELLNLINEATIGQNIG